MMTFFPTPYEDEILYSTLARYHQRSGNTSFKATIKDLFGDYNVTAVMDLPANINRLIKNMPMCNKYTSGDLIFEHTLYPLYTSFLPPDRAGKVFQSMTESNGGDLYNRTGLMASSISLNRYFMFCPECMKEDLQKYGEYYWHRIHQVPCITLCPKHKVILQVNDVEIRGFNKFEYKIPTNNNSSSVEKNNTISDSDFDKLVMLGNNVRLLLDNKFDNKPIEWFKLQYINHLKRKGLANVNGIIYMKELVNNFVDYFGDNFLKLVQSPVDIFSDANWLCDMVRNKNKTSHVIRHLLIVQFLGVSLYDLFSSKYEFKPFGNGPWICLNKAVDHYHQPVVEDLKINYDSEFKIPIGTFTCKCGFIYTRRGPDETEGDKYKLSKIKQFGPLWESKLRELSNLNLGLREIARRLGVDPGTIKKYSLKLGLKGSWSEEDNSDPIIKNKDYIKDQSFDKSIYYRKEWLKLQEQYKDKSKKELRELNKAVYAWLYRNDKEWLIGNSPINKPTTPVNKRIDWEARDREILNKIRELVESLLTSEDKPERISVGLIGKKLGINSLIEKHMSKMPQTKAYIETVKESNTDFHIRKIKWAVNELDKEGEELLPWKVFRKAGIRGEYQNGLEQDMKKLIEIYNDYSIKISSKL